MSRRTKIVIVAIGLLVAARDAGADVEVDSSLSKHSVRVFITNQIKKQDVDAIAQVGKNLAFVSLVSDGGDVDAAMAIGRMVREQQARVMVPWQAKCLSSCSLIYIAGVTRLNAGIVGLHRPYLAGSPLDSGAVRKAVPQMLLDIKNYVSEMGITDEFYNIMVNTEPAKMRAYAFDDINTLVPSSDPLYDELVTAREARRIGITTAEYRKRNADGERCTGRDYAEQIPCREALLWGLSEPVYVARNKEAMDKCRLSEADLDVVYREPKNRQSDHPVIISSENCKRAILLQH